MDKVLDKIHRVIQKNNEETIFELIIRNYDKSNFFIALVFNKNIEKFKVLFVPVDAIEKSNLVEEYFCYQFIFMNIVNHLLKLISEFQDENSKKLYDYSDNITDYNIEFNTYKPLNKCTYIFRQYISPDFEFFFDLMVSLFEHVPNVMNDLQRDILAQFNSKYELLKYNMTIPFRLKTGDLNTIFDSSHFQYDKIDIQFLEKIGDKYYGVINDNKVLVDHSRGMLRIYSGRYDPLGEEMFLFITKARESFEKKFYRLDYIENDNIYNLLCYGYNNSQNIFLVHNNLYDYEITLKDVGNKKVKIHDVDDVFKEEIISLIKDKYVEKKALDIINFVFEE